MTQKYSPVKGLMENLCLRGGQDHWNLRITQFICKKDHWRYVESLSKNFHGGVADQGRKNKVVRHYAYNNPGKCCHVHIQDFYLESLPKEAKDKICFLFYSTQEFLLGKWKPWFSATPVGRNTLDCLVKMHAWKQEWVARVLKRCYGEGCSSWLALGTRF